MRLTSFTLENYGNFREIRLSLAADPGWINLVLAPNGAGKTVLRRAFRDWLFGIPGQSRMGFRFGYPGMRLSAEGIDRDGSTFAIGRRKGSGNTLIDAHGNSLDPRIFDRLIGDADEALFKRLFALDTELLRDGARAMIETGGELAEALFAAGSGIAGLRRLREGLEASRDDRAPARRVGARPFYQALNCLAEARSDLRSATVRPQTWQELSGKLAFAREQLDRLARAQSDQQREIARLERVRRVRPWLEQREAARRQCVETSRAPQLPPDTGERWRQSAAALVQAEHEVAAASDELRRTGEAIAAEQPDEPLLQNGERIDALDRRREQITADLRDLPRREAERNDALARLATCLSALGIDSFEAIASVLPNSPQIAEARELIKRNGIVSERGRKAGIAMGDADRAITEAMAQLEQIGTPPDVVDLSALFELVGIDGDPARRMAELRANAAREEARLNTALAKLPLWDKGLDALTTIIPPTRQLVDRTASALEAAGRAVDEAEGELQRLARERAAAEKRLAEECAGKSVPDEAAVAAARAHRDVGWSLIRRSKFEDEPLPAEIAAYASSRGLAGEFEGALRNADDLADRRDAESHRLARIEECERQLSDLDQRIGDAKRRLAEAHQAQENVAGPWRDLVGGLGLPVAIEAGDLRDILTARHSILDVRAVRDEAQAALAAETRRQEFALQKFATLLPEEKCGSLTDALAAARQIVDLCNVTKQQRGEVEARLAEIRRAQQRAEADQNVALSELTEWQSRWQVCLCRLRRPVGETPPAAEKAIELIGDAHQHHDRVRDLHRRIAGMQRNIAEFEAEIADLVGAVARDLQDQPPQAATAELRRRLAEQRDSRARRDQLLKQRTKARGRLDEARRKQADANVRRQALRVEIGGSSDEETEARIDLAARRADAEKQLEEVDSQLCRICDDLPIEALEKEAAEVDPERIDGTLADLRAEVERISNERVSVAGDEERVSSELRRIASSVDAIDAEERRQAGMAAAIRISEEALLYHAAACLIRRGMERLRDLGEEGLIHRIGEVFRRMTAGAYAGVAADEDAKGTPYLIAIEADGTTTKRVDDELSDGTRDQLFLALRLVMVEEYARKAPALPFIADDLLQSFDDYGRTVNALAALAELSQHAQVIVLSHHRQLAEIARGLPDGKVNFCQLAEAPVQAERGGAAYRVERGNADRSMLDSPDLQVNEMIVA